MADMVEKQAQYLQANGMQPVMQALFEETVTQQPADPFAFMSAKLSNFGESYELLKKAYPDTADAAAAPEPAALEAPKAALQGAGKEDGWWTKWNGPDPTMSTDEKVEVASVVAEEIIKDADELRKLYERKAHPVCYDGFEPSGRMHIAQGLQRAMNVNRLTSTGVKFVFWVADYFALMNNKMGGDIDKIQDCGRYMIEIWKACGMDLANVEFVWASDFINEHAEKYWLNVLQIALKNSVTRITRCCQIMGRSESEDLAAAQIFYPCMQCNDVFMLKCDMTQLGMDQRKVNMLAREYCEEKNNANGNLDYLKDAAGKMHKPVIMSHHMLGALDGDDKMSKSKPDSAIFMEDSVKEVQRKIKKSFCPEGLLKQNVVDKATGQEKELKNGCMEYIEYIVLPKMGSFTVERKPENGGTKVYTDIAEVKKDFVSLALHPGDLKPALATAINTMLDKVRTHFETDPTAKELLRRMKGYMAERAATAKAAAKKSKKEGAKGAAPCFDAESDDLITCLDIRVGEISNVRIHEKADGLFVESIAIGAEKPRTVCSGLVGHVKQEDMKGLCMVVCNLKARKMQGIASEAMLLAAVAEDGTIEILRPPAGAKVGDIATFDGITPGTAATPNQLNKGAGKKALIAIFDSPELKVSGAAREASWKGHAMKVGGKAVTTPSIVGKVK